MVLRSHLLALSALALAGIVLPAAASQAAPPPPVSAQVAPPSFDTGSTPPPATQHPATRPEVPAGSTAKVDSAAALAASTTDCPSLRYCAWTGGYFSGPSIAFTVGGSYNWRNYGQSACSSSGTSGANWSNCASSTRNRSTYATAYHFALAGGQGYYFTEIPGQSDSTLGVFDNNIDSSIAA